MRFPTTCWTHLAQATLHGDPAGQRALEEMCAGYRGPVEAYVAARGLRGQEAEDAVQEFFLSWLKSRAWKRADRLRGKFRTFLLGALQHMLNRLRERDGAQKRGGGMAAASLEALAEEGFEVPDMADPALPAFDRRWAVALVARVSDGLRRDFEERGKSVEFALLREFLPGSGAPPSQEAAAAQLGMSLTGFKAALHRMRERFREQLRAEVARTVSAPHEVEEELRYLRSLLLAHPPAENPQEAGT